MFDIFRVFFLADKKYTYACHIDEKPLKINCLNFASEHIDSIVVHIILL